MRLFNLRDQRRFTRLFRHLINSGLSVGFQTYEYYCHGPPSVPAAGGGRGQPLQNEGSERFILEYYEAPVRLGAGSTLRAVARFGSTPTPTNSTTQSFRLA